MNFPWEPGTFLALPSISLKLVMFLLENQGQTGFSCILQGTKSGSVPRNRGRLVTLFKVGFEFGLFCPITKILMATTFLLEQYLHMYVHTVYMPTI